jgi:hypothetical protein
MTRQLPLPDWRPAMRHLLFGNVLVTTLINVTPTPLQLIVGSFQRKLLKFKELQRESHAAATWRK